MLCACPAPHHSLMMRMVSLKLNWNTESCQVGLPYRSLLGLLPQSPFRHVQNTNGILSLLPSLRTLKLWRIFQITSLDSACTFAGTSNDSIHSQSVHMLRGARGGRSESKRTNWSVPVLGWIKFPLWTLDWQILFVCWPATSYMRPQDAEAVIMLQFMEIINKQGALYFDAYELQMKWLVSSLRQLCLV